jgi:hypothetical protein
MNPSTRLTAASLLFGSTVGFVAAGAGAGAGAGSAIVLFDTPGGALGAGMTGEPAFFVGCCGWRCGPHELKATSTVNAAQFL